MISLERFHIVREQRQQNPHPQPAVEESVDLTSEWLHQPDNWDLQAFIAHAGKYLMQKNGSIDMADQHLLVMLAAQIEIYVESVLKLRTEGLVIAFNGGITLGPNPCIAIADRSLHRIIQLMKELELSPKSRNGYQSKCASSPELLNFLNGP